MANKKMIPLRHQGQNENNTGMYMASPLHSGKKHYSAELLSSASKEASGPIYHPSVSNPRQL